MPILFVDKGSILSHPSDHAFIQLRDHVHHAAHAMHSVFALFAEAEDVLTKTGQLSSQYSPTLPFKSDTNSSHSHEMLSASAGVVLNCVKGGTAIEHSTWTCIRLSLYSFPYFYGCNIIVKR